MKKEKTTKFQELALDLKDHIEQGKYQPGSLIPSEPQLQAMYQVSRTTVREAIELLVNDGYVRKKRGRWSGTYVLERNGEAPKVRKGLNFGTLGNGDIIDSNRSDVPAVSQCIISELSKWEGSLSLFPFLSLSHPDQLMYVKKIIARNLVDGFFLWGSSDINQLCEYLLSINFPFVFICTTQKVNINIDCPRIYIDENETIRNVLRDFMSDGVGRVVLIAGSDDLLPGRTDTLLRTETAALNMEYQCLDLYGKPFGELLSAVKANASPQTLLVTSNELLESVDNAVSLLDLRVPEQARLLLFKHYAPDWRRWEGRYPIIDRPYAKLGKSAVQMMNKVLMNRDIGLPPKDLTVKLSSYCI